MFGNPGSVEQGLLDAVGDYYPEFQYILALEEATAVAIADGFARKTKKPAVIQLHSGVGLGNGIGMLYQAMRGHAPLIVLAGEAGIKYDAMEAHMAADIVAMAKPVTKWATRVVDSSSLLRVIRRAVKVASTPPMGPVFVCLPMDILDMQSEEEIVPSTILDTRTAPDDSQLERVAKMLIDARHPVFIIGDGIAYSGAQDELAQLVKLVAAEVWAAEGSEMNISGANPNYRGLLNHMSGKYSKAAMAKADVIFVSGTYLFPEVFPLLADIFPHGKPLIHIDLNAYEIAKNFPVDIGIVSDPKLTFKKLNSIVERIQTSEQKETVLERNKMLADEKRSQLDLEIKADIESWDSIPVIPGRFMREFAEHMPPNTIIFDEAETCSVELNRYILSTKPGCFFQTRWTSLGVGIPGAIGLKIAAPEATVIGFGGDGGSMYTIQALWTAAHYNIGAKFVVCNNQGYRILQNNLRQYWQEHQITGRNFPESFYIKTPEINYVQLSEALGVTGVRVEKPADIRPAIEKMFNHQGPFLIDLLVNQTKS
ncbi:MAG: thiamine pyrophosphate TPP-binding protein [Firmicutes bacterium]|nr:thiamine pyrophosphate TPP-binding protein [Bacillota bacterium]